MDTKKIDSKTIEITKVKSIETVVKYNIDELVIQRKAIQAQKDRDNIQRDTELAEVDELIQKCTDLGIVPEVKPLEDSEVIL